MRRFVLLVAGLALAPSARPLQAQKIIIHERLDELELRARVDSNDAAAHYNVGVAYLAKKRFDDAERAIRQAIALEPGFGEAHLALAIVRARDEKYWKRLWKEGREKAVREAAEAQAAHMRRAFLVDPFLDIRILGGVRTGWGGGGFLGGIDRLTEGRYEAAFEAFERELRSDARRHGIDSVGSGLLWYHAIAAARSGHDSLARRDFEVLLARAERRAASDTVAAEAPLLANEYRYMLAALAHRARDYPAAVAGYRDVLANDLGNYMAHVQLARIHEELRQWDEAIAARRRAIETNPEHPGLRLDLGVTLAKAGRRDEAVAALHEAIAANARDARPHYWLGLVEKARGDVPAARTAFTRFVELAPSRYAAQITAAKAQLSELR